MKIFYFWESKAPMPTYLQMIIKSWENILQNRHDLIKIDFSNMQDFVDPKIYSLIQKVAIPYLYKASISDMLPYFVFQKHAGLFLDIDTLLFQDPTPVEDILQKHTLFAFGQRPETWAHVAALGAQKNSPIMEQAYHNTISHLYSLENLSKLPLYQKNAWTRKYIRPLYKIVPKLTGKDGEKHIYPLFRYEHWGASLLNPILGEYMDKNPNAVYLCDPYSSYTWAWHLDYLYFKQFYNSVLDGTSSFWSYYFSHQIPTSHAFHHLPIMTMLRNACVPQWYKKLSMKNFLKDKTLLTRLILQLA